MLGNEMENWMQQGKPILWDLGLTVMEPQIPLLVAVTIHKNKFVNKRVENTFFFVNLTPHSKYF